MDLEHFIAETLTQIARGVRKAGENLKDSGGLVSPRGIRPTPEDGQKNYGYLDESEPEKYCRVVEEIEFDVAVTATTGTETKGGIGVMVGIIGLGSQGRSEAENSSVSHIKFRVPMVLPNP